MSVFTVNNSTPFTPQPSFCKDKWCSNKLIPSEIPTPKVKLNPGSVPTTGQNLRVAQCGDLSTMVTQKLSNGGITGRGVTPCPFGYLQKHPWDNTNESLLIPYQGEYFNALSPSSIFFDPSRPSYLPPQGQPRSLVRIGYEWRD
jgi:hypothetical protein